MASSDRFLSLFFEEARELLQELEAGLMDLEARQDDREHLNRTFRAAHTLKGAAGMVGLRPIADFTHAVEAVLDKIRSGTLAVSPAAISLLLRSRDHLGQAVEKAAREQGFPEPPPDLLEALTALASGRPLAATGSPPPAEATGAGVSGSAKAAFAPGEGSTAPREPANHPSSTPRESAGESPGPTTYRVRFTPGPDLFRRGVNPVGFLDELAELGTTRLVAHDDWVPPLEDLDPTTCHLAWTVDLTTDVEPSRIDEVFLLLEDRGQVTVEAVPPATDQAADVSAAEGSSPPIEAEARPGVVAAAADEPKAASAKPASVSSRVRVDAERLDQLVGMAGELAVLTDSLPGLAEHLGAGRWSGTLEALERLGRLLRDATLELRMVSIEELFVRFPRVVRDIAERLGKRIDLQILGADTQLDRTIIERLADPMIHLIRNAIDHGLEPPEERVAAGKSATGRITITAGHEGDRVAIRIGDDGRGLDRARILEKGVRLGLIPTDTPLDDPRVGTLIFEAGFSTKDQVGDLSGRGVGLDVVRDTIRGLRGTVSLKSVEGKGTTFLIQLPLTLAMIDGLLVESDGDRYVVPIGQVDECVALEPPGMASTLGRPAAVVRGELVPIVSLRGTNGPADAAGAVRRELLLTRYAEQRVAVAVDRLLGRVQTVIQPLDPALGRGLGRYSGATILGDGSVSLILDLSSLVVDARSAEMAMVSSNNSH